VVSFGSQQSATPIVWRFPRVAEIASIEEPELEKGGSNLALQ
jgi:hypothetical protein